MATAVDGLWIFSSFAFIFVFFIVVIILLYVFWIFMIVDAAKRKFKNENDKILWILVVVLAQIIGAIVYYFVVKRQDRK